MHFWCFGIENMAMLISVLEGFLWAVNCIYAAQAVVKCNTFVKKK
jgi:hypothetical protein